MDHSLFGVFMSLLDVVVNPVEDGTLLHHKRAKVLEEDGQVVDGGDQLLDLPAPHLLPERLLVFFLQHRLELRTLIVLHEILLRLR